MGDGRKKKKRAVEEDGDEEGDAGEQIARFEKVFEKLEGNLAKLMEIDAEELEQKCNPIERAQYNVVLAKAINVLYAMYLKTQGIDPDKHPVAKELERIAKYGDKLKAADSSGPKLSLDSEAALRFLDRSLPDLSPEKKKALKELKKKKSKRQKG
eukprot:CAMPEP_0198240154 /NCGR_PEP_ID=MMETSP1446-20131203/5353_1 /TAXON_ID=1461542 ORGANISM="Unidentified sp, Strain CCMP2111" /NCGR_SAMPLE_ID=MMETSP1446 /ASSEMBLY_ACC=CAM_ASM_001112 /LENGTH=154 /DNA_ID=CAMNT_0043922847 /DNA_START=114 /DNA_END=578 /DNA_ORIENTATION=-